MRVFILMVLLCLSAVAQQPGKTLVDYRTELGLSEEQVQTVNRTLEHFKTQLKAYQEKLLTNEKQLALLLTQKADVEKLKATLRTTADIGFQMQYLDVVTARKVEAILTQEQLEKWRALQQKNQQK